MQRSLEGPSLFHFADVSRETSLPYRRGILAGWIGWRIIWRIAGWIGWWIARWIGRLLISGHPGAIWRAGDGVDQSAQAVNEQDKDKPAPTAHHRRSDERHNPGDQIKQGGQYPENDANGNRRA